MKRLLRISFDLSLLSFIPILSWFCLSLIVDKNLINIFTLTYPIQFVWYILKSIFSTGANINKEKDNNKDAVMSGIVVGTIIAFIFFGLWIAISDSLISKKAIRHSKRKHPNNPKLLANTAKIKSVCASGK